jgi:ATP-dependent Clp protease adaptor protein ClpS
MSEETAVVVETKPKQTQKTDKQNEQRRQPPYDYVIEMLKALFGYPVERGFQMAKEVDTSGRVIVSTTTKEHAELKRDQIHAYGPDSRLPRCKGSMSATIEAAE